MKKSRWIGILFFLVLLIVWGFFYSRCGGVAVELFPERTFEVFPLNDSAVGGFSTSEVQVTDTLLISSVTIRLGKAFSYAGVGFNLLKVQFLMQTKNSHSLLTLKTASKCGNKNNTGHTARSLVSVIKPRPGNFESSAKNYFSIAVVSTV